MAAVGIGIPSTIDQREGTSVFSVHVPLAGVPLRERGEQYLGLPVAIDNDANAAAMAEWTIGAGRGTQHMIMLTLGTGIGGGLILGGRLYRGASGAAAELGPHGARIRRARVPRLLHGARPLRVLRLGERRRRARRRGVRAGVGLQAARRGCPGRRRAGSRCAHRDGRKLGAGIASLVNIFDPEPIVIGGGFGDALDLLLQPALETLRRDALPPGRDRVRVLAAELGEEAGMVGAGLIAFEKLD